ncbi:MAG: DUF362 domain-containing protein [Acidobacteria bacterium]|nr:DUF362 domain-containing protein [Acidobacteriota bacterium]MBU4306524.1 DUF362 domain-containing protein [Acidobacteriota bacterium]MBU4404938.1 DUF362 domain-containing protein [Acidobacteriota bacterium]MCG2810973.1 DUF362 domain-containing protein [Candidatus Aminicenantes bacterium]
MKKKTISRRKFIKDGVVALAAGSLALAWPGTHGAQTPGKTRVVLIRDQDVLDESGVVKVDVVQKMLDEALRTLLDEKETTTAWKKIIRPTDVVGIKSNVWRSLPTPPQLEEAIRRGVLAAGVKAENISVRDRGVLNDPVFMKATALVNVRPLRTHDWSGLGTCIKNYIMFVPDPPRYHPDSCADLATLWQLPEVKGKTRLNILVMLTPLFHSVGPHGFNPSYVWKYNGLLVGLDPVAVDATGARIIQAKRREFFGEDRPINPPPKHIGLADTRHHLGTADPNKIELIKLGGQDGILI